MRKIYEAGDVFRRIIYNRAQMAPQSSSSDAVPTGSSIRKRLLTLLKISITVLGLIIVIRDIDFQALLAYMSEIDWAWMAVGAGLIGISLVIRTYRWHILLSGAGSKVRFSRLLSLYLIGSFFNAFLPSGLGGDVVRAAEAAQDVESSVAVGTVLVDRLTGLMALFIMALAVLPFRPPEFPSYLAVTVAGICISGLMLGFVLVDGRLFFWFIHHLPGAVRQLGGGFISRSGDIDSKLRRTHPDQSAPGVDAVQSGTGRLVGNRGRARAGNHHPLHLFPPCCAHHVLGAFGALNRRTWRS